MLTFLDVARMVDATVMMGVLGTIDISLIVIVLAFCGVLNATYQPFFREVETTIDKERCEK